MVEAFVLQVQKCATCKDYDDDDDGDIFNFLHKYAVSRVLSDDIRIFKTGLRQA